MALRQDRPALDPERVAIDALGFLAADPERLDRFLALTGLAPDALRLAAREPGFLGAVLDHLMTDDDLIRSFSAEHRLRPEVVADAHRALSGAGSDFA